ncbi:MAG: bacteriohemerythrin [Proteobacteria bacterium]|nr:bacteriohemerythrin [Pseudomonadota bacterium]
MVRIKWLDEYGVGHQKIDDQHKKWLEIYNTAHAKMMNPDENVFRTAGLEALQEMQAYGEYHFSFEENYMESIGFAGLAHHKQLHLDFLKKIEALRLDIHNGIHVLNSEIIKTIENWLVHHILNEDQKIKTIVPGR